MSIRPKNIPFDPRPCLFDKKIFYSTKSHVYSTKNYSIRPKAMSIRPKIILFDQKQCLFDQKLFYSTKSRVYSTKNCSIRPKAVSIRPKFHSFDQKSSPWSLVNPQQKMLLCFKIANDFNNSNQTCQCIILYVQVHFDKGEETKSSFSNKIVFSTIW